MKNKTKITALFCISLAAAGSASAASYGRNVASGNWSTVSQWNDNSSGSFIQSTQLPGASDTVGLNNDRSVTLDTDASVIWIQLVNNPTGGTLNMNAAHTLTLSSFIDVGHSTHAGAGLLNQSAGTLSVGGLVRVYNAGTYNLTGGVLAAGNTVDVFGDGLLDINGGSVTANVSSVRGFGGTGTVKLQAGSVSMSGTSAVRLDSDLLEISGGSLNLDANVVLGFDKAAELRIIGDGASLSFNTFAQAAGNGANGTVRFVFDETGVSAINVAVWMNLSEMTLIVDGSAYTGGAGTFDLITAGSFLPANIADTNNFTVTGFAGGAFITQDTSINKVTLTVIPEPNTYGLLLGACSSFLILLRRGRR